MWKYLLRCLNPSLSRLLVTRLRIKRWRYLLFLSLCLSHFNFTLSFQIYSPSRGVTVHMVLQHCWSPLATLPTMHLWLWALQGSWWAEEAVVLTGHRLVWGQLGVAVKHVWTPHITDFQSSILPLLLRINHLFSLALPMLCRGGSSITLVYLAHKCIHNVCANLFQFNLPSHWSLFSLQYLLQRGNKTEL